MGSGPARVGGPPGGDDGLAAGAPAEDALGEETMVSSRDDGAWRHLNQSVVGGGALVALAAVALWALRDLDVGTLGQMGPAFLPRALAVMVGASGIALIVIGVTRSGERISGVALRGALVVPLAILLFALTIRPVDLGFFHTPGLGLMVAGPLTVIVGGFATTDARLRELVPLAFLLIAFCIVLFGDLLNLPIPVFPEAIRPYFGGLSHRGILRAIAAGMTAIGLVTGYLAWAASRRTA